MKSNTSRPTTWTQDFGCWGSEMTNLASRGNFESTTRNVRTLTLLRHTIDTRNTYTLNPSGWGINIVDAPLSGAWHVLWGPTGTPWARADGCHMLNHTKAPRSASVSPSARRIPHDEGRLKWPDQCHPDSRETMTPHAR